MMPRRDGRGDPILRFSLHDKRIPALFEHLPVRALRNAREDLFSRKSPIPHGSSTHEECRCHQAARKSHTMIAERDSISMTTPNDS